MNPAQALDMMVAERRQGLAEMARREKAARHFMSLQSGGAGAEQAPVASKAEETIKELDDLFEQRTQEEVEADAKGEDYVFNSDKPGAPLPDLVERQQTHDQKADAPARGAGAGYHLEGDADRWQIFIVAHWDTRPACQDPRIMLGPIFAGEAAAVAYANDVQACNPCLSVRKIRIKNNTLVTLASKMDDAAYCGMRNSTIVGMHMKRREFQTKFFEARSQAIKDKKPDPLAKGVAELTGKTLESTIALKGVPKTFQPSTAELERANTARKLLQNRHQPPPEKSSPGPATTVGVLGDKANIEKQSNQKQGNERQSDEKQGRQEGKGKMKVVGEGASPSLSAEFPLKMIDPRQLFAVLLFVLDAPDDALGKRSKIRSASAVPEFVVHFMRTFSQREEAEAFCRDVCGPKFPDFEVQVVDLYQWLDPYEAAAKRDRIKEQFKNSEQNEVMGRRTKDVNDMDNLKQFCDESGLTVPVTEIYSDGTVVSTDMHGNKVKLNQMEGVNGEMLTVLPGQDGPQAIPGSEEAALNNGIGKTPVSAIPPRNKKE